MPILINELSVWDVSFRWADSDPDKFYFSYPLAVKDNFRLLMQAILKGEIICSNLVLAKRPENSKADPQYYIRTHIDKVENCITGNKFDKKLLKWATLKRDDFYELCTRRGITPPEFWFPKGWKLDYDVPVGGYPGSYIRHVEPEDKSIPAHFSYHWPEDDFTDSEGDDEVDKKAINLRTNQRIKIACQVVAQNIWKKDNTITIADMARKHEILKLCGAEAFVYEVVRRWLREVAPPEVSAKRGRPKSKNTT